MSDVDRVVGGELPEVEQQVLDGFVGMEFIDRTTYAGLGTWEAALREFALASGCEFAFTDRSIGDDSTMRVLAPAMDQTGRALDVLSETSTLLGGVESHDGIVAQAQSALTQKARTEFGEDRASRFVEHTTSHSVAESMQSLAKAVDKYLAQ